MSEYQDGFTKWDGLQIFVRRFSPPPSLPLIAQALVLHGGGEGNSERTANLCAAMARHGLHVVSFDCEGHGKSEGTLLGSSLQRRRDLAHHVVTEFFGGHVDLTLGFSMGGPTAFDLASDFPQLGVSQVFMVCSAAYAAEAFSVPFGPEFKAVLSMEDSWKSSTVMQKLKDFQGGVFVITPEHETVIPKPVTAMLFEAAQQCRAFGLLKVPGVKHQLALETMNDKDLANLLADMVMALFALYKRGLAK